MSSQDLEMQISQYADGSLTSPSRANLESSLNREPKLRDMLNEYRQLDASMGVLAPLPAIQWEMFADRVSASVASASMNSSEDARLDDAAIAGRIDSALARTAWMRSGLAAGLLLTLCSGALLYRQHRNVMIAPVASPMENVATNDVTGPKLDPAAGPVLVQVNVGGAPAAAPAVQTASLTNAAPKAFLAGDLKPVTDSASRVH